MVPKSPLTPEAIPLLRRQLREENKISSEWVKWESWGRGWGDLESIPVSANNRVWEIQFHCPSFSFISHFGMVKIDLLCQNLIIDLFLVCCSMFMEETSAQGLFSNLQVVSCPGQYSVVVSVVCLEP